MSTVTESKQDQLDLEPIAEYVRESKPRPHDVPAGSVKSNTYISLEKKPSLSSPISLKNESFPSSETDVLETLWPGIHHHDFAHTIKKRTPGFYLIAGFSAGIAAALILGWFISLLCSLFFHDGKFLAGLSTPKNSSTETSTAPVNHLKAMVPLAPTYEVQDGDTLAAIALRNYKHISPRLLDAICKTNGLSDANVLSPGQKINLPEYTPQQ